MFTGISKKICGALLLTGAVFLLNAKEPWAYFKREVKILMPSVAKFQSTSKGVCTLLDAKGQKTGTLLLELIPDEKRKMGYAGTIEVAVLLDRSGKIAGDLPSDKTLMISWFLGIAFGLFILGAVISYFAGGGFL